MTFRVAAFYIMAKAPALKTEMRAKNENHDAAPERGQLRVARADPLALRSPQE